MPPKLPPGMERPSQAPWIDDRSAWGRIRLTKQMWETTYIALKTVLQAKWNIHHTLPNPSDEGRQSMHEIRELQKVIHNLEGLAEEKGWSIPTY